MIVSTFALLRIDSGFTAMSSVVRVASETAVHTLLEIFLKNRPQTKAHVRSQFIGVYGKACRFTLYGGATESAVDAAPQFGAPKHDEVGVNLSTGRRRPAML